MMEESVYKDTLQVHSRVVKIADVRLNDQREMEIELDSGEVLGYADVTNGRLAPISSTYLMEENGPVREFQDLDPKLQDMMMEYCQLHSRLSELERGRYDEGLSSTAKTLIETQILAMSQYRFALGKRIQHFR